MAPPSKGVRIQVTCRIPPDVHRRAVVEARRRGWTLNDLLVAALDGQTIGPRPPQVHRQNLRIHDDNGNVLRTV